MLAHNQSFNSIILILRSLDPIFHSWEANVPMASNSLRLDHYNLIIFSNASLSGWGAICETQDFSNISILCRIDNNTAISYINRMGGIQYPSLNAIVKDIWQWGEARNIFLLRILHLLKTQRQTMHQEAATITLNGKLLILLSSRCVVSLGTLRLICLLVALTVNDKYSSPGTGILTLLL